MEYNISDHSLWKIIAVYLFGLFYFYIIASLKHFSSYPHFDIYMGC